MYGGVETGWVVSEGCCEVTAAADVVDNIAENIAGTEDGCATADDDFGGAVVEIPAGCGVEVSATEGVSPARRDMKLTKV